LKTEVFAFSFAGADLASPSSQNTAFSSAGADLQSVPFARLQSVPFARLQSVPFAENTLNPLNAL
jgi:hypothetical protein